VSDFGGQISRFVRERKSEIKSGKISGSKPLRDDNMCTFRCLALLSPNNHSPMPSSKQELKTLLAQGKLETALETLVRVTAHGHDAELRQRVLTLSGQFAQLKNQHLTGLLDDKDYRLQWNRIAAAVADIADNQQLSESSHPWKKWATILAVLASIAGITGYTLRDFLWPKPEPTPIEQSSAEPAKRDTIVVATPPASKPAEKPSAAEGGKNNVNIKVQDKAKVGNIITGDSNKIDIKQDFGQ
jgi:hypothetical protein